MFVAQRSADLSKPDAYRELNSKRLFWIVLMLSGLVVAGFAIGG